MKKLPDPSAQNCYADTLYSSSMGCHYTTMEYRWTLGGPTKAPIETCFEKDVQYIGDDLNMENSNNNYGKTKDALACQVRCQTTAGCAWFNRDKEGNCLLKKSKGVKKNYKGGVSGPRSCKEGAN